MALKAIFIGINKYSDQTISELNGASRDAKALWALFTDTIEGLSGRLLIDETATLFNVKQAIFATLSGANEDDTVIITFAGHGSADGNLVMYDTQGDNVALTSVSMISMAEAFKQTKARAVLFILDCCFSGQAPARVLETDARPRNILPLSGIAGEGRILLAACAAHESAWEQPGTGHGLLTYATIHAMQGAAGQSIQFPDVGGEIIRLARVEAERIGVSQTPVFLGNVAGGLIFPALQKGENFRSLFPGLPSAKLEGRFDELLAYGVTEDIVSKWAAKFPNGLNALQLRAVNDYRILEGNSLLIVAPTSSGKTMVGELSAIQAVLQGKKAAFLLPYRALVNEKYQEFEDRYASAGLRVVRCSGDSTDGIAPALSGRYDIGFFTYETFLNMSLNSPRLLNQLGTVVLDEAQFITDPSRGIIVELILALLLRGRQRAIQPQLIVLSAVIGNLNNFDKWLGIPFLVSKERPVPLIEGVLDRRGIFQFIDVDGSTKQKQLLKPNEIVQRRDKPSSQDVIVPLAKSLVANSEKVIIFRNMRGPAQGCAKYLSNELGLPAANQIITELPNQDLTTASVDLRECLAGGTAFHNTNLLRDEREAIEKGFRNVDGGIFVLAATTTLAAGINTPASTVVLAENEFMGEDGRAFTVAEYKNMAGRAGRLGFNEIGKAIILADTPIERARLFQKYVLGSPEEVRSSFQIEDLSTWVLRLLSQVRGISINDIPSLLINTFGGYSASLQNPEWKKKIEVSVKQLISRMINTNLAVVENEILHLTLLGRACATSSLTFESSLRLVELMSKLDTVQSSPLHILAVIQVLNETDALYTPVMKKGRSESARLNDVASKYGREMIAVLQRFAQNEIEVWQRCKRAAIIWDWINGEAIDALERRYTANPFQGVVSYGDITRIVDGTRFHLRSAHQILSALFPQSPEFLMALDDILLRLEFGLPQNALPLTKLPTRLTRGKYLALYNAGCSTPEDIKKFSEEELVKYVGILAPSILASLNDIDS